MIVAFVVRVVPSQVEHLCTVEVVGHADAIVDAVEVVCVDEKRA